MANKFLGAIVRNSSSLFVNLTQYTFIKEPLLLFSTVVLKISFKICSLMNSNPGSLVSEMTALPIVVAVVIAPAWLSLTKTN